MDWDLGIFPEPLGKTYAFNQLLDNLRTVHEETCARNAVLEKELSRFESTTDDPWLPANFVAPREGPPPRRPPRGICTPKSTFTPRSRATDIVMRGQDYLIQSIDNLAEEQDQLREQITKVLTAVPKKAGLVGNRASMAHGLRATFVNTRATNVQHAGSSSATASATAMDMSHKKTKKSIIGGIGTAISRFAVRTSEHREARRQWTLELSKKTSSVSAVRKFFQQMLHTTAFATLSGLVIFAYAVTIAVETNILSQDPDMQSSTLSLMHYCFTAFFCVELILRWLADSWETFCGEDAAWNRLDAFFILSGATELIIELTSGNQKAGSASAIARGVRIFRVFRTVRLVRTFKEFYEFQKMAYALLSSVKTLLCSLALLSFVMFFFAVWFTQSAADLQMRDEIEGLDRRYGDLMSTAYTLFLSISGGIGWDECYMPLHKLSFWSAKGFVLYIALVYFGVLNVVTSVFVESVIRKLDHYKDIIVKDKEDEKKIAMAHVKEVFKAVDGDGSGTVSLDEMEHFLEEATLSKYMEALDIDVADTRLLFRLLDYDGSGNVSVDEFCEGCLRLKGGAKSIDMAALTYQLKSFLVKWGEFTQYVDQSFAEIRRMFPKK